MNSQRIEDLVTAYKILLNEDVLDSFGHVSVRSATDPDRFLMPYALPPSLVRAEDVIEYTVSGQPARRSGGRKVNGERYIHGEIYKARPDVQAVIHSHSQAVIPFSVAGVALRPVIVQAGFLPLETPNFEIRDARGNERGMQITTIARGAALAKTLGNAPVALMRGHGNVVVGSSVKQATVYAVYADINARMQAAALALKTSIVVMNEPELFDPSEFDINRPWEHFRQKLDADARKNADRTQFGLAQTQQRAVRPSGRNLMVRVAFIVGDYPSEESTRREQVALSYSNSEVQVGIVRAPITPYFYGMTQCEMTLVAPTVIEAFHRAAKRGLSGGGAARLPGSRARRRARRGRYSGRSRRSSARCISRRCSAIASASSAITRTSSAISPCCSTATGWRTRWSGWKPPASTCRTSPPTRTP